MTATQGYMTYRIFGVDLGIATETCFGFADEIPLFTVSEISFIGRGGFHRTFCANVATAGFCCDLGRVFAWEEGHVTACSRIRFPASTRGARRRSFASEVNSTMSRVRWRRPRLVLLCCGGLPGVMSRHGSALVEPTGDTVFVQGKDFAIGV